MRPIKAVTLWDKPRQTARSLRSFRICNVYAGIFRLSYFCPLARTSAGLFLLPAFAFCKVFCCRFLPLFIDRRDFIGPKPFFAYFPAKQTLSVFIFPFILTTPPLLLTFCKLLSCRSIPLSLSGKFPLIRLQISSYHRHSFSFPPSPRACLHAIFPATFSLSNTFSPPACLISRCFPFLPSPIPAFSQAPFPRLSPPSTASFFFPLPSLAGRLRFLPLSLPYPHSFFIHFCPIQKALRMKNLHAESSFSSSP